MCISYSRVLQIQKKTIVNIRCKEYKELGVVCSPLLEKGYFTSSAIDNIDFIQTSVTVKKDFIHATCISIFQHTFENTFCEKKTPINILSYDDTSDDLTLL